MGCFPSLIRVSRLAANFGAKDGDAQIRNGTCEFRVAASQFVKAKLILFIRAHQQAAQILCGVFQVGGDFVRGSADELPNDFSFDMSVQLDPIGSRVCRAFAILRGLGRGSISNYEYGLAALQFGAGIKLCRRLDLNQQWLATGNGPRRPYVPLTDLGLSANVETLYSGTFLDGYNELLAAPIGEWLKKNPVSRLIEMQVRKDMEKYFSRQKGSELEQLIREESAMLREAPNTGVKLGLLYHIQMAAAELHRRLEAEQLKGGR